ncbi:MAG TPA: hypothetical protein VJ507_03610 [Candidatus Bathyarchaeia archaeon]|nr:hypothetical protein [Candidatus Bathyarchaeia archaeon]
MVRAHRNHQRIRCPGIAAVKNYKSLINMVNTIRRIPSVDQLDATFVADTAFPSGKEFNDLFTTERSES